MLKRLLWPVGSTLAAAAAILLFAWYVPLTTTERVAINVQKASDKVFLLRPGESVQQRFRSDGTWQSGVVLYATAPVLDQRQLQLRVLNKQGRELARGSTVNASYIENNNTLRLSVATTWFKVSPHDDLFLDSRLLSGPPLPLKVIEAISGREDIALGRLHPVSLPFAARQGVLAGIIVMLGTLGITLWVPKHWQWRAAAGLLVITATIGLLGFWYSPDRLGISDWDYYFSLHNSYRQTILQYHQLPLWNPYICGGTSGIGDPEFPIFTPTFLLELIFGIPRGLRLAIYFATITGGIGMLALMKHLRLSVWAGLLAALVYMFSTVNLLEIVEGHVNVFAAMWLPWIWWSWLSAYGAKPEGRIRINYTFLTALFFALTFLQAGIYLLVYTLLALGLVILLAKEKWRAFKITALAGFWALGLVAIKLVPVLLWLNQFPQQTFATSAFSLPWLADILFGRHLHGVYIIFRQRSGWHEYGAYIGYIVFALSLLGLTQIKKRRTVALLTIIGGTAFMLASLGPALDPVFNILWFIPRSNISRIIILTIIALAILAGFGLDALRQRIKSPLVPILLIGLVAVDLLSLAYPASQQAFVLPPFYPAPTPPPPPIAYTVKTFDYLARDTHRTRTYEATKVGWGSLFHCSVLGPKPAIVFVESDDDANLLTVTAGKADINLTHWSPNKITAEVAAAAAATVTLNANYADGWLANNQPAENANQRVAATIPSGQTTLHFAYRPPGFRLGLIISLLTLLLTIPLLLFKKR